MTLQINDKAMLKAGYHGRRGKMGRRKVRIKLITRTSDGGEVALVHFESANEPPRWVHLMDLERR